MTGIQVEWERIRLEIERLRVSGELASGPAIFDPRGKVVEHYLSNGMSGYAWDIVRGMRDNPIAAVAGYEVLTNHFLKDGQPYYAHEVAREEHAFLKRLSQG
jgi:hypothetical protein